MITLAKYKEVVNIIKRNHFLDFDEVAKQCGMAYDAIVSIYSQVTRRKERVPVELCNERWQAGETLLEIATSLKISPFTLVRELFESPLRPVALTARAASACIREPHLLRDLHPRLAAEFEQLGELLDNQSISSSRIRQLIGSEYEVQLQLQLRALGVPFVTEERLRTEGVAKTPDIRLLTPIYIDGIDHEINWIDSKAMFGDHKMHAAQIKAQFVSYVNMFGPGLVIYWFGYVDIMNPPNSAERPTTASTQTTRNGTRGDPSVEAITDLDVSSPGDIPSGDGTSESKAGLTPTDQQKLQLSFATSPTEYLTSPGDLGAVSNSNTLEDPEAQSMLLALSQPQYWHPYVSVRSSLPNSLRLFPTPNPRKL